MKNFLGKVFKVKEWSDWDRNISTINYLKLFVNNFLNRGQINSSKSKDFEKIRKKYNLDDKKLKKQSLGLLIWSIFFLLFYLVSLGYVLYNLQNGNLKAFGIGLCISMIPLSLAFRYHFYYISIKFKRLDCTLKDWVKLTFGIGSSS
jgi:intracellular multiplication protein IcmV